MMDASSYFLSESENFDDEFYRYQTIQTGVEAGFQDHAQSLPYFEGVSQPTAQSFDESYVVGSNQFQVDRDPYPYQGSMTGPPSATFSESPIEDFQYIDFSQSYMPESQASLNILDGFNDTSVQVTDTSNAPSNSTASKDRRVSKTGTSKKPPHSRQSSINAPSTSHKVSPQPRQSAAKPSFNVQSRSAKKSKGPPKDSLNVFEVNPATPTRRKSRSVFNEETKKKVEAVRRLGACIECRFRKRTVSFTQPRR